MIIKNGIVADPASDLYEQMDILVKDGKIVKIAPDISCASDAAATEKEEIIDHTVDETTKISKKIEKDEDYEKDCYSARYHTFYDSVRKRKRRNERSKSSGSRL